MNKIIGKFYETPYMNDSMFKNYNYRQITFKL